MEINSIVNGYTLKKSIHTCSKRTLWSARSNSTGDNYILSFYKTIGSTKAAEKQQKLQQIQKQLKHAVRPVHIFDYSSSNTTYRVEAMHEIDGINMHNLIFQERNTTPELKQIRKAIDYCNQLIEGLEQLERIQYQHDSLKLQSLMVRDNHLYVLGSWTSSSPKISKKKTEEEKNKEMYTKQIAYSASVKNVLLQILLKKTETLISSKTTEEEIQKYAQHQFVKSADSEIGNLIKRILITDPKSKEMLAEIKKELSRTFQIIQSKNEAFRFLLPLSSIEEDQNMIETDRWQSKICRVVNHKKLNLRYGEEDGVQYLFLKYQKLKVIYTYDWIPEDIKTKFTSIRQIFEYLKEQEIEIINGDLVLKKMPKIVNKSKVMRKVKPEIIPPVKDSAKNESVETHIQEKVQKAQVILPAKQPEQDKQVKEAESIPKLVQKKKSTSKKPSNFRIMAQFPVLNKDASVEECQILAEKIQILKQIKDFDKSSYYTGERYENMGVEYFKVEKFNESMDCFVQAINNCRRLVSQQNRPIIMENPSLYHNIALLFAKCNRPQQAIYYSRQSIKMISQSRSDQTRKAETFNLFASILLCYYNETALSRQNILAAFNCGIELEECATSRRLLNTMGITLVKEQQYERACEFFIKAVNTKNSQSDSAPDDAQFAFIFINLANAYSFLSGYKNSLGYVKQGLNICCSNEEQIKKQVVKVLLRLTLIYSKQKNAKILREIKGVLLQYKLNLEQYCPNIMLRLFKLE